MSRSLRSLAPSEIESLVVEHFGVPVRFVDFLPGDIAINARVQSVDDAANSETYVFKAEYPSSAMSVQYADWVSSAHQAAYEAGVPVAKQVPARAAFQSREGSSSGFVTAASVDGEEVIVRLQSFLPGVTAAAAQVPEDYPTQVGRLAGQVTAALAHVKPAPDMILHPWAFEATGQNVLFASERLQNWEASGQVPGTVGPMLTRVLAYSREVAQEFESAVRPALPTFPHQVVHQDINDINVLVDGGRICGLLDFGDCRVAARMAEPAIAAAYALTRQGAGGRVGPRDVIAQVTRGYREVAEVTDEECELMEPAAIARLCLGACTWAARVMTTRPGDVAYEYGRSRLARTWPVLTELARR